MNTPSLYTLYPAASAGATQLRAILDWELPVPVRPVGAAGGIVSGTAAVTAHAGGSLSADSLPAASIARTVQQYSVDGVKPLYKNTVVVDSIEYTGTPPT